MSEVTVTLQGDLGAGKTHIIYPVAPKRPRAPHPSGYQLAKAKNARMLSLINAISDQCAAAGSGPQCEDQVAMVRGMIAEWRYNG